MAQVVLQTVGVGRVVEQEAVDVGQTVGTQQVAQLFIPARRIVIDPERAGDGQLRIDLGLDTNRRLHPQRTFHPIFEGIERLAVGLHPVTAVELRPVDLRIAFVAGAPHGVDGLERLAREVTGQVMVVVGTGRRSVVPGQRTLAPYARLDRGGCPQQRRHADPAAISGDTQRQPLAPHPAVTHIARLTTPCGIVVIGTPQHKRLLHRRGTQTALGKRHDEHRRPVSVAPRAAADAQGGCRLPRINAVDERIAPETPVDSHGQVPPAGQFERQRAFGTGAIVAGRRTQGQRPARHRIVFGERHRRRTGTDRKPPDLRTCTGDIPRLGLQPPKRGQITPRHLRTFQQNGRQGIVFAPPAIRNSRKAECRHLRPKVVSLLHGTVKKQRIALQFGHPLLLVGCKGVIGFVVERLRKRARTAQ